VNAVIVAVVVFLCTFSGAMTGMWLRTKLPSHHLDGDSRDIIKLATGLIATMTALVLGLVIATAKGTFDKVDSALEDSSADILAMDRALARYGPEAAPLRQEIRDAVALRIAEVWPEDGSVGLPMDSTDAGRPERIIDSIRDLSPASELQRAMQAEALELGDTVLKERWLIYERGTSAIEEPFLVVLVCWLTLIFTSFGLFSPRHGTTVWALVLCGLSIGAAVFLILELDGPFDGVLRVPSTPLRYALARMGQ
jgi:hypothetical protein